MTLQASSLVTLLILPCLLLQGSIALAHSYTDAPLVKEVNSYVARVNSAFPGTSFLSGIHFSPQSITAKQAFQEDNTMVQDDRSAVEKNPSLTQLPGLGSAGAQLQRLENSAGLSPKKPIQAIVDVSTISIIDEHLANNQVRQRGY